MLTNGEKLIVILQEIKNLVDCPKTNISWSRYSSVKSLIQDLDDFIQRIQHDDNAIEYDLKYLFAPTGSLQEISIDSGWGSRFIELSGMVDQIINK